MPSLLLFISPEPEHYAGGVNVKIKHIWDQWMQSRVLSANICAQSLCACGWMGTKPCSRISDYAEKKEAAFASYMIDLTES